MVSKYMKLKIISGYILLFLIGLFCMLLIYEQIIKLSVMENQSNSSRKLFLTGNIITGLYEAETLGNAFVQTGAQSYFNKYLRIQKEVENSIDSLKALTVDFSQQLRIDSIHVLLGRKVRNLQRLVQMKRKLIPADFYTKAIANISSGRDSVTEQEGVKTQVVTTLDSTYVKSTKKKKWRLFSRAEPDSVLQITVSHHTVVDSTRALHLQNTDSVIQILQSVWQELQERSENVSQQINRQEYALICQSAEITDQLHCILVAYEQEEIRHSLDKIEHREQVMNATAHIIAWIAVTAFLLILFFIFFILRDLSRSQRYRRELEAANRYAGHLLKSREKMILTVTHDIKSPLSSVIGYIELLNEGPVDERQRYYLKNMKGSAEHILKLVGNLLDLSKLENNKMEVEEVTFNPVRLFQEISDNFLPLAKAKQLVLVSEFAEELDADFRGDALRIRQIITNILSNAVKYTAKGEVGFAAGWVAGERRLQLRIWDSGPGMTGPEQQVIFEEFTRLKSHSAVEGTGLGLTITLKLIHLLGGALEVESKPGKGSCFTVVLPLKRTERGQAQPVREKAVAMEKGRLKADLAVLLVDDDPLQLEMTAGMLRRRGIRVETTAQPAEVPDRLKTGRYDLLISDIQMPGMTGFDLVRLLRTRTDMKAFPVIALSADADKTGQDYLEAGFTAYLGKPFTSGQLMEVIAQVTGRTETCREAPEPVKVLPSDGEQGYTLKHILQFADQDRTALKAILESFVAATREHLRLLQEDLQAGKTADIVRLAHKMLPMFRQLEAEKIVGLLQYLEQAEQNGGMESVPAKTAEVREEILSLLEKMAHHSME